MTDRPHVCVIGAGASGLTTLKALIDAGLSCVCYEKSDRVGGLWVFKNRNGQSAAYRSLHINTSRDRMQFRDYPMPRDYPDYPAHPLIARYFEEYARAFELLPRIRFGASVERVSPREGGGFDVALGDGSRSFFDAVVVANGHHWDPRSPEIPGDFTGVEFHSHAYIDPSEPHDLRDRHVVVVGFGNSAVDIACDLAKAQRSGSVTLSTRRGAWVLPKYALGRPLDQAGGLTSLLPRAAARGLAELWYRVAVGDPRRFGLPKPDHRLGDAHPTLSDELLPLLAAGAIRARPALVERRGRAVRYADGSSAEADAIVYATGYKVSFPFFDPEFVSAPENELGLYLHVFHPDAPGVYFIGLCQPLGPIMPLAEAQAKLVAKHLTGEYELPLRGTMLIEVGAERERVRRRFGASPRHTMQVDFDDYLAQLARALASTTSAVR